MKRISILCSLLCIIAFVQCSKDEPISEMIVQEEESYENLEKVETIWEEGCEKLPDNMDEVIKDYLEYLSTPDKTRLLVRNNLKDFLVITLEDHCGGYPMVKLAMDNEDSSGNTAIYTRGRSEAEYTDWLKKGVDATGRNLTWHFCLVPKDGFPTTAVWSTPWGLPLIDPDAMSYTSSNNIAIQRLFDLEDNNPKTKTYYSYSGRRSDLVEYNYTNINLDLARHVGKSIFHDGGNVWMTFQVVRERNIQTSFKFPYLGFSYAIFINKQIHLGADETNSTARIVSDDEDNSNRNGWNTEGQVDFVRRNTNNLDLGFIKGGTNTELFVAKVDPNRIFLP